ncbi:MAG: ribonuclease R [Clostridia bacterium]|nr:ribonuclease R [Clostridia bacterium]
MREILEGKIDGTENGYAFFVPDDRKKGDFFVSHKDLNSAVDGDRVLAETENQGGRTTAFVLKVIERGRDEITGTFFNSRKGGYVVSDDKKFFDYVYLSFGKGLRANAGDKVVCKILAYHRHGNPEGIITKVFGHQFEKKAEIGAICYQYGIIDRFKKPVIDESEKIEDKIEKAEIKARKDLRNLTTFTIDGDDAKDFDDAVSVEILKNGSYRLGVHIADVSHYVNYGGVIDKEAQSRGTSVYFPETVIPMLPEKLCNGVCSLLEGKDRLTLSCIMDIDKTGEVISYEIVPSVINSKKRTTYNEVQKVLDGDKDAIEKYALIYDDIKNMDALADILIKKREERGSIDLETKESIISVDKKGKIEITPSAQNKAQRIIEEFMICANCTVAEFMYYSELPFIYRVHKSPEEDRLDNFYSFLKGLDLKVKRHKGEVFSKDFQLILKTAKDKPYYTIVNRVMLRSMQKAKYSPENIGHFGLSERFYCHFTSPIRRYPDLTIHRIIKDYLKGATDIYEKYGDFVIEASEQSSLKEKNAETAERAVDDYYKALYMSNYEGETFDGIVSGIIGKGIFVELNNGVEGFVDLDGNRRKSVFDKNNYTLTVGKTTYKLGEKVQITVSEVNLIEKKIFFILSKQKDTLQKGGNHSTIIKKNYGK